MNNIKRNNINYDIDAVISFFERTQSNSLEKMSDLIAKSETFFSKYENSLPSILFLNNEEQEEFNSLIDLFDNFKISLFKDMVLSKSTILFLNGDENLNIDKTEKFIEREILKINKTNKDGFFRKKIGGGNTDFVKLLGTSKFNSDFFASTNPFEIQLKYNLMLEFLNESQLLATLSIPFLKKFFRNSYSMQDLLTSFDTVSKEVISREILKRNMIIESTIDWLKNIKETNSQELVELKESFAEKDKIKNFNHIDITLTSNSLVNIYDYQELDTIIDNDELSYKDKINKISYKFSEKIKEKVKNIISLLNNDLTFYGNHTYYDDMILTDVYNKNNPSTNAMFVNGNNNHDNMISLANPYLFSELIHETQHVIDWKIFNSFKNLLGEYVTLPHISNLFASSFYCNEIVNTLKPNRFSGVLDITKTIYHFSNLSNKFFQLMDYNYFGNIDFDRKILKISDKYQSEQDLINNIFTDKILNNIILNYSLTNNIELDKILKEQPKILSEIKNNLFADISNTGLSHIYSYINLKSNDNSFDKEKYLKNIFEEFNGESGTFLTSISSSDNVFILGKTISKLYEEYISVLDTFCNSISNKTFNNQLSKKDKEYFLSFIKNDLLNFNIKNLSLKEEDLPHAIVYGTNQFSCVPINLYYAQSFVQTLYHSEKDNIEKSTFNSYLRKPCELIARNADDVFKNQPFVSNFVEQPFLGLKQVSKKAFKSISSFTQKILGINEKVKAEKMKELINNRNGIINSLKSATDKSLDKFTSIDKNATSLDRSIFHRLNKEIHNLYIEANDSDFFIENILESLEKTGDLPEFSYKNINLHKFITKNALNAQHYFEELPETFELSVKLPKDSNNIQLVKKRKNSN